MISPFQITRSEMLGNFHIYDPKNFAFIAIVALRKGPKSRYGRSRFSPAQSVMFSHLREREQYWCKFPHRSQELPEIGPIEALIQVAAPSTHVASIGRANL